MSTSLNSTEVLFTAVIGGLLFISGCGTVPVANTNSNGANSMANSNLNANANAANANVAVTVPEATEPAEYQATVTMRIEAIGEQQSRSLPPLSAKVARSGDDRQMIFTMPAGGRVVFLDRGGQNYLVLPDRKQYAELDRESLGFDVRRMLMPEQIVEQVKGVQGVERVGEEQYNGRAVIRYNYAAVADTESRAGQVATESFLIVDKETGLPLRSETVSRSQSGGNVQGYQGVRVVTEITDVQTDVADEVFAELEGLEKIQSDQVRAQVDMIFSAVANMLVQMMDRPQPTAPAASPTAP